MRDSNAQHIDAEERNQIMESFNHIGKSKSLGYLPLYTVETLLRVDPKILRNELISRGLNAGILSAEETCIKSGAVFAFAPIMVTQIIERYSSVITQQGWPIEADHVIRRILATWYEEDHEIMPLIRELYGDATDCEQAQHS